jgi:spore photoproduct lyase
VKTDGSDALNSPPRPSAPVTLTPRRSRFIELFRTTPPRTVCPNFHVLAHANGCAFAPMCDYCYLKASFRSRPAPRAFTNTAALLREVRRWIRRDGQENPVLNTGNLSDSLAFEEDRPLVADLVELFRAEAEARSRPHTLLLVTKGGFAECALLRQAPPCANVVISFSVNHPDAAALHEPGAAPPAERLAAAAELRRAGWRVRLRIDPMIAGFDYAATVSAVAQVRPERVTLGTLRAEPSLLKISRDGLFSALESPAEPGGLARYPWGTRLAIYRPAMERLRPLGPVALCEEPAEMWDALGLDRERILCNCCL